MEKIKLGVILLALLQPIIIVSFFGLDFKSFSKCWGTSLEPLFVVVNAVTSFFFFSMKRWRISSIFLLLVVAFSTEQYSALHNIFATGFFISCIYGLLEFERMKIYLIFYLLSLSLIFFGIFWVEVGLSYTLSIYQLNLLWIKYKFENR